MVFLPSVKHIMDILVLTDTKNKSDGTVYHKYVKEFEELTSARVKIHQLHGGLTPGDKEDVIKAFDQNSKDAKTVVNVVLATRIAETAITLGSVRYVIDSGLEKEFYFNEET
jgi:HrpA-like RNA helicase